MRQNKVKTARGSGKLLMRPACWGRALFMLLLWYIPAVAASDQLIVFVQPGKSTVDSAFHARSLPQIKEMCADMDVTLYVIDARKGVPDEVVITPLLVLRNTLGRSVYQGRTTTPERIRNFIRTTRRVPQGGARYNREQILTHELGRARIWAPVKIAAVTGEQPQGYDHTAFSISAGVAIEAGMTQFKKRQAIDIGRGDRGFYMDFYPWRSPQGTLFLSLALYSQFDCKHPVFSSKGSELSGPWAEREKLFIMAGARMEREVLAAIHNAAAGDAFDPVDPGVRRVSWEQLGLPVPQATQTKSSRQVGGGELPLSWQIVDNAPLDPPMVQFRFPAPLDNYSGIATRGTGEIIFTPDRLPRHARGYLEVDPRSVTMGDPELDQELQGPVFLSTAVFPGARFTVRSVSTDAPALAFGQLSTGSIEGVFSMKGVEVPLSLSVDMEQVLASDDTPRLIVTGSFQIDLPRFKIQGADGPVPAKNTLVLDLYLTLAPKMAVK